MKIKDVIDNFSSDDIAGLEANAINNADHNWSSEQNGYVKDWQEISTMMKMARNYTCAKCGWKPKSDSEKRYIHTHHKNRDKDNNSSFNLEVLCIDCHYKNHPKFQNNSEHKKFLSLTGRKSSADLERENKQKELEKVSTKIGNLYFQDSNLPVEMYWKDACEYCEKLKLGGFSDWRLPNLEELKLAYKNKGKLKNVKPNYHWSITNNYYWSTTKGNSDSSHSWIVNFYSGYDSYRNQTTSYYVRCVR